MNNSPQEMSVAPSERFRSLFSLKGRTAIVTGAVGHLGSAISQGLAAHGAHVILVGRTASKLEEFVQTRGVDYPQQFTIKACDITDVSAFKNVVAETIQNRGSVDILVNNAFNEQRKPIDQISLPDWDAGIKSILTHAFFCSQAVLPEMLKQSRGSIINVASIYGFLGIDQRAYQEVPSSSIMYSAAKGGVLQITRRLSTEYGNKGVRVNAISPGFFPKPPKAGEAGRPKYVKGLSEMSPMGRVGTPWELPGAAVFLASDASTFVTGQNLVVDGGLSAW